MTPLSAGMAQVILYIALIAICHVPLGRWMARVAEGTHHTRVERACYRIMGVDPDREQDWRAYLGSLLGFSLAGVLLLYGMLRVARWLPFSFGRDSFPPDGAFNTAVSFLTNTNWQWYSGETLGHTPQLLGLAVQNFTSAAVGICVAFALVRGFARQETREVGNFFVDATRTCLRLLLPMAFLVAIAYVLGGALMNFTGSTVVQALAGGTQEIPGGPAASQEAIKQLGTNGGGFFNGNASHPFENPTPWTNILAIWAMTVIPFSLPHTFGLMVGDRRQGRAIVAVMGILQLVVLGLMTWAEVAGRGLAPQAAGAALEGKEWRFGIWGSTLFASAGTGTSTGAVNSMHDSYTAAGGGLAMLNMMLGEVSPGGVGTGLYGILVIAVITVFISGLMVGRTPEYLGKKIGQREITASALYILAMPAALLLGAAISILTPGGRAALANPGPHGLSEMLYGYASAANNNGSAFAGLGAADPVLTIGIGLAMLIGRFVPIACTMALAGSLARQRRLEPGPGTLPTHAGLFVTLCLGIVVIVAALTFFPALALGPIAEALQ